MKDVGFGSLRCARRHQKCRDGHEDGKTDNKNNEAENFKQRRNNTNLPGDNFLEAEIIHNPKNDLNPPLVLAFVNCGRIISQLSLIMELQAVSSMLIIRNLFSVRRR